MVVAVVTKLLIFIRTVRLKPRPRGRCTTKHTAAVQLMACNRLNIRQQEYNSRLFFLPAITTGLHCLSQEMTCHYQTAGERGGHIRQLRWTNQQTACRIVCLIHPLSARAGRISLYLLCAALSLPPHTHSLLLSHNSSPPGLNAVILNDRGGIAGLELRARRSPQQQHPVSHREQVVRENYPQRYGHSPPNSNFERLPFDEPVQTLHAPTLQQTSSQFASPPDADVDAPWSV